MEVMYGRRAAEHVLQRVTTTAEADSLWMHIGVIVAAVAAWLSTGFMAVVRVAATRDTWSDDLLGAANLCQSIGDIVLVLVLLRVSCAPFLRIHGPTAQRALTPNPPIPHTVP